MVCTVGREIGRGSNALVYQGFYFDRMNTAEKHIVLVKELFPYHPQGAIERAPNGDVAVKPEGRELYQLHRLSFEHGNEAHLRLLRQHPEQLGGNLNTFACHQTMYTVLGYSGGRSLDAELTARSAATLRLCAKRMLGILDALQSFHECGYLHLDVSPDNVLLTGEGDAERVLLIDFNSVYGLSDVAAGQALYCSAKEGYSAPEMKSGLLSMLGVETDLFSVAAIFYRCLAGEPLSAADLLRPSPPDGADSPLLSGVPDTVRSMVRHILRKGLHTLVAKRYHSAADMRADLTDLIDRIDGRGVTHWALWEAGMRDVRRMVRENPSLRFLASPEGQYPLMARAEDGASLPVAERVAALQAPGGASALLTGAGGMGKTTVLLQSALKQGETYAPGRTVALYIPLYGWRAGEPYYVEDRILDGLRFKPDTPSFADARHALRELMRKPIPTKAGDKPTLLLLLDGLNEATGDTTALYRELRELAALEGVRLLITSRGDAPQLPLTTLTLEPLTDADVADALLARGLLAPESAEMRALLRTPLMLTLYARAAELRQSLPRTEAELLDAYLRSLGEKECAGLADDADMRWQVDVAVRYVLPVIAKEIARQGGAISEARLHQAVRGCYRLLSTKRMLGAFPQWLGHSRAIRGGARNADEWYGMIVHGLLWRRMGLLVRDSRGSYTLLHAIVGDYLRDMEKRNAARVGRGRRLRALLCTCLALAALATGAFVYVRYIRPQPYAVVMADAALDEGMSAYARLNTHARSLLALVDEPTKEHVSDTHSILYNDASTTSDTFRERALERMFASGDVMPWSLQPLNATYYAALLNRPKERAEVYLEYLRVMSLLLDDERHTRYLSDFAEKLRAVVNADMDVGVCLYALACDVHQEARYRGDEKGLELYERKLSPYAQLELRRSALGEPTARTLTACETVLQDAETELHTNAGFTAYEKENAK